MFEVQQWTLSPKDPCMNHDSIPGQVRARQGEFGERRNTEEEVVTDNVSVRFVEQKITFCGLPGSLVQSLLPAACRDDRYTCA
jgi:hypothetical protein